MLLLMKGHPGTGKSTLARALAARLRCPLLDKDDIKDHTADLDDGNDRSYAILWQLVETQLKLGLSVVVDSPLAYPRLYATGRALAKRYGVPLLVVETHVDATTWVERLTARDPNVRLHTVSDWASLQALLARYDGCWRYPIAPEQHVRIDTGGTIEACVERVLTRAHSQSLHR